MFLSFDFSCRAESLERELAHVLEMHEHVQADAAAERELHHDAMQDMRAQMESYIQKYQEIQLQQQQQKEVEHEQQQREQLQQQGEDSTSRPPSTQSVEALSQQLVRSQEAAAKEINTLQQHIASLSRDKLAVEQAAVEDSHRCQTLEHELGILQTQLQTLLAEKQPKRTRGLKSNDETIVDMADKEQDTLCQSDNADGLANCVRLLTDGAGGRQTVAVYLLLLHVLTLFLMFKPSKC